MRRHRRDLEIISEMNLTNLLDTAFILLIAFMLVAPMLKHGIEIELPEVSRGPIQTSENTITIVIQKSPEEGFPPRIYIEEQRVELGEIEEIIRANMERYAALSIAIECDRNATFEPYAKIMSLLQNIGIKNIALVTLPEDEQ